MLLINDEGGALRFENEDIWDTLNAIGYERNLNNMTFKKPLFCNHWRYLIHVLLHSLSAKKGSWDQFGRSIASALVGLAT